MKLSILGITAYYHGSAGAVVKEGQIVAAAQEERFTGIEQDRHFPKRAVDYVQMEAGLTHARHAFVATIRGTEATERLWPSAGQHRRSARRC